MGGRQVRRRHPPAMTHTLLGAEYHFVYRTSDALFFPFPILGFYSHLYYNCFYLLAYKLETCHGDLHSNCIANYSVIHNTLSASTYTYRAATSRRLRKKRHCHLPASCQPGRLTPARQLGILFLRISVCFGLIALTDISPHDFASSSTSATSFFSSPFINIPAAASLLCLPPPRHRSHLQSASDSCRSHTSLALHQQATVTTDSPSSRQPALAAQRLIAIHTISAETPASFAALSPPAPENPGRLQNARHHSCCLLEPGRAR